MEYNLKQFDMPVVVSRLANIHYFELRDDYFTVPDSHSFCELLYVDKGKIWVDSDSFSGELTHGECIVHMADEKHSFRCTGSIAPNLIIIGFECESSALFPLSEKPIIFTASRKKLLAKVVKDGMSVYAPPYGVPNTLDMKKREKYPFGADQMIKLRLENLLILLVRDSMTGSKKYERKCIDGVFDIYQYITEHYTEKITLDNLAFLFGTNKTTLCKSFKEKYNTTILEFINELRINEAKKLLSEKKLSITEISERLGFASLHYFSRIFKSKEGISPGEYADSIAE